MNLRLAHLILVHDNPIQLERLVRRLLSPNTDVYIHLDMKCHPEDFGNIASLSGVFFIANRTSVIWGEYSMMEATLKSFEEILNTAKTYSHINLLSGSDYPLKHVSEIERFLFANADKTFMKCRAIYGDWEESLSRLTKYNLGAYRFPFRYVIQRIFNSVMPKRKVPKQLKPYGMSQWITITPDSIKYVTAYLKENPSVRRFFKLTWGVDELLFQTVLLNSPLRQSVVNDHLRYIKFQPRASRPNTLTMADAETLVNSGKLFARKFSLKEGRAIYDFLDQAALDKSVEIQ
jgi:hypothetical protein